MLFRRYICAFLIIGMPLLLHPAFAESAQNTFGYKESRFDGLKPFPKWRTALERFGAEKAAGGKECSTVSGGVCNDAKWITFLNGLKKLPKIEQLKAINDFANKRDYVLDPINWGVDDYWETPLQFFAKNGDCEDYAIVKYLSLRELGWSVGMMKIVVLHDSNLNVAHANLVVDLDGRRLVLDNQFPQVIEQNRIHHYKPIYGINEENWWRYRKAK